MKPLICFYKNSKFIYSDKYLHLTYNNSDWYKFLAKIEKKYFSEMKILKINFEAGLNLFKKNSIQNKISLYEDNLIDVLILKDYKIISSHELNQLLNCEKNFALKEKFIPLIDKQSYKKNFKLIKNDIKNGLYYQVNYTIPFMANYRGSSLSSFNYYHNKFKGEYHALMPVKNGFIVSCSPELFLAKNKNHIISEPIKGTSINNEKNISEMMSSKKEEAELSMIVDLVRNDFNSISDISNAKVEKHRKLLFLDNLVHTYSKVTAKTSLNVSDILKILPTASISGCPKYSSVLKILEYEKYKRNFYTGNLGWWQKDELILNVLIRSFMFLNNQNVYYHAGGGIVYDSKLESEYKEIFLKGKKINE